ncbi:MAG TPA: adenine nucleotide alpha hydrolase family protein [Candidatus Korarchaeota archaeon]|nr:adenine nucleotide alpha hydrolase family protein [Candidatus Korarchaeota archaeon]
MVRPLSRCKYCNKPAEHFVPNLGTALCEEHFLAYFYKRVRRVLSRIKKGKRVLVGVSGGKDSIAALYALSALKEEFELEIGAVHIDLGFSIREFVKAFERACERTGAIKHLISLKEDYGFTVPELAEKVKAVCHACGVIRRYLLNKLAWEEGYDFVATGHNLDDMAYFAFNNLITHNISFLKTLDSVLPPFPELKLAGRIRPLFWLSDADSITYLRIMGAEYSSLKCPYHTETKQIFIKPLFNDIQRKWPQSTVNFVTSLRELARRSSMTEEREKGMRPCSICGYPSQLEVCSFCRLRKIMRS